MRRRRIILSAVVFTATTIAAFLSSALAADESSNTQNQNTTQSTKKLSRQYNSKYRLRWKTSLGYQTFESITDSSTIASGGFVFDGQGKLANELYLRAKAQMRFESGASQSLYREIDQNNGLFIREAYADYRPFSFLRFKAGAISQGHLNAPLLVSNRSFPAVTEKLIISKGNTAIILKAQQAIPTSSSFDQERSEKEEQASFQTQTLEGRAVLGNLLLKGYITNFEFKNLPSKVAFQSSVFGNTVPDNDIGFSNFVFDYAGQVMGAEAILKFGAYEYGAGIQQIENTEALEKFNMGRLGFVRAILPFGDHELALRFENFFNESDSSVAFYNSALYGHNNRVGYSASAKYSFRDRGFAINAGYVNSDVINQRALESQEEKFALQLETFFEDF
jgi:hypothetical protein